MIVRKALGGAAPPNDLAAKLAQRLLAGEALAPVARERVITFQLWINTYSPWLKMIFNRPP